MSCEVLCRSAHHIQQMMHNMTCAMTNLVVETMTGEAQLPVKMMSAFVPRVIRRQKCNSDVTHVAESCHQQSSNDICPPLLTLLVTRICSASEPGCMDEERRSHSTSLVSKSKVCSVRT